MNFNIIDPAKAPRFELLFRGGAEIVVEIEIEIEIEIEKIIF